MKNHSEVENINDKFAFNTITENDLDELENWLILDDKIAKFASESIKGDYEYYSSNPIDNSLKYRYMMNKNVWLLKVTQCGNIIAYLILFYDKLISNAISINPIIVSPKLQNEGHGATIVQKLIKFAEENNIDYIKLGCFADNYFCIKMIEKLGFQKDNILSNENFSRYYFTVNVEHNL